MTATKLYTINEAAGYLKITRKTLYKWRKAGKIKAMRTPGGQVRITLEELNAILIPDGDRRG